MDERDRRAQNEYARQWNEAERISIVEKVMARVYNRPLQEEPTDVELNVPFDRVGFDRLRGTWCYPLTVKSVQVVADRESNVNATMLSFSGSFVPFMGFTYGVSLSIDSQGNLDCFFDLGAAYGFSFGVDVASSSVPIGDPPSPYSIDYGVSIGPVNASFPSESISGLPKLSQSSSVGVSLWSRGSSGPLLTLNQHWLLYTNRVK